MEKNIKALHEKALEMARTYLRAEADLVGILREIDEARAFRELGYRSLFEYARRGLSLSEGVAYNLIVVARKSREVPLLQEKLSRREISLSNARMIAPVLTPATQEKWLNAAQTLSRRELEKAIARERPELLRPERARYVREDRLRIELNISEALYQSLKRAQDRVSVRAQRAATMEDTLLELVRVFLERHDPIEKARRARMSQSGPEQVSRVPRVSGARYRLPAALRHALVLRDGGQCSYRDPVTGARCEDRRWLEFHHLRPKSLGGADRMENLATLCRAHHQRLHWIG
ncbi:MAG: HNH endonuclease [Oligoflexia bacterium]|nr:HNH endonuclease [Oligoflexia bacterium]